MQTNPSVCDGSLPLTDTLQDTHSIFHVNTSVEVFSSDSQQAQWSWKPAATKWHYLFAVMFHLMFDFKVSGMFKSSLLLTRCAAQLPSRSFSLTIKNMTTVAGCLTLAAKMQRVKYFIIQNTVTLHNHK